MSGGGPHDSGMTQGRLTSDETRRYADQSLVNTEQFKLAFDRGQQVVRVRLAEAEQPHLRNPFDVRIFPIVRTGTITPAMIEIEQMIMPVMLAMRIGRHVMGNTASYTMRKSTATGMRAGVFQRFSLENAHEQPEEFAEDVRRKLGIILKGLQATRFQGCMEVLSQVASHAEIKLHLDRRDEGPSANKAMPFIAADQLFGCVQKGNMAQMFEAVVGDFCRYLMKQPDFLIVPASTFDALRATMKLEQRTIAETDLVRHLSLEKGYVRSLQRVPSGSQAEGWFSEALGLTLIRLPMPGRGEYGDSPNSIGADMRRQVVKTRHAPINMTPEHLNKLVLDRVKEGVRHDAPYVEMPAYGTETWQRISIFEALKPNIVLLGLEGQGFFNADANPDDADSDLSPYAYHAAMARARVVGAAAAVAVTAPSYNLDLLLGRTDVAGMIPGGGGAAANDDRCVLLPGGRNIGVSAETFWGTGALVGYACWIRTQTENRGHVARQVPHHMESYIGACFESLNHGTRPADAVANFLSELDDFGRNGVLPPTLKGIRARVALPTQYGRGRHGRAVAVPVANLAAAVDVQEAVGDNDRREAIMALLLEHLRLHGFNGIEAECEKLAVLAEAVVAVRAALVITPRVLRAAGQVLAMLSGVVAGALEVKGTPSEPSAAALAYLATVGGAGPNAPGGVLNNALAAINATGRGRTAVAAAQATVLTQAADQALNMAAMVAAMNTLNATTAASANVTQAVANAAQGIGANLNTTLTTVLQQIIALGGALPPAARVNVVVAMGTIVAGHATEISAARDLHAAIAIDAAIPRLVPAANNGPVLAANARLDAALLLLEADNAAVLALVTARSDNLGAMQRLLDNMQLRTLPPIAGLVATAISATQIAMRAAPATQYTTTITLAESLIFRACALAQWRVEHQPRELAVEMARAACGRSLQAPSMVNFNAAMVTLVGATGDTERAKVLVGMLLASLIAVATQAAGIRNDVDRVLTAVGNNIDPVNAYGSEFATGIWVMTSYHHSEETAVVAAAPIDVGEYVSVLAAIFLLWDNPATRLATVKSAAEFVGANILPTTWETNNAVGVAAIEASPAALIAAVAAGGPISRSMTQHAMALTVLACSVDPPSAPDARVAAGDFDQVVVAVANVVATVWNVPGGMTAAGVRGVQLPQEPRGPPQPWTVTVSGSADPMTGRLSGARCGAYLRTAYEATYDAVTVVAAAAAAAAADAAAESTASACALVSALTAAVVRLMMPDQELLGLTMRSFEHTFRVLSVPPLFQADVIAAFACNTNSPIVVYSPPDQPIGLSLVADATVEQRHEGVHLSIMNIKQDSLPALVHGHHGMIIPDTTVVGLTMGGNINLASNYAEFLHSLDNMAHRRSGEIDANSDPHARHAVTNAFAFVRFLGETSANYISLAAGTQTPFLRSFNACHNHLLEPSYRRYRGVTSHQMIDPEYLEGFNYTADEDIIHVENRPPEFSLRGRVVSPVSARGVYRHPVINIGAGGFSNATERSDVGVLGAHDGPHAFSHRFHKSASGIITERL